MNSKFVLNYINGQWVKPNAKDFIEVKNPATGEVLNTVPLSTASDVNLAVDAAREAFWDWRTTPPVTRARYLFKLKNVLEENFEELVKITVTEAGKTLDEARGEYRRALEVVETACGIPSLLMGYNLEDIAKNIDCAAIRQPMGVFAAITPYNFPAMVPFWFWPFAVACGNTFIVKPSEQDPLSQVRVFELLDAEVGFPPGVINMVNGSHEAVNALLEHPDVKGISFVGSSQTAGLIYQKCGAAGKRSQCFGGAKNRLIVMPDCQIDAIVPNIIQSAFGCAGQRCLAGSVVIAVGDIYESLKSGLKAYAQKIKVGYGMDESVQMGPLISPKHQEKVLSYITKGIAEGAELLLDGRQLKVPGYEKGFFIGPTIFDKVTPGMVIANEEIFGPVLSIIHVRNIDEAIDIITKNSYGNAASIFTNNGKWARDFSYKAECSMMGINIGLAAPMAFFPFGGTKGSFYGDLKAHGRDGISFFTDAKVVITKWS